MFNQLGDKFQTAFKKLSGKGRLSEKDIDEALREIRLALFEADVNFKVVKSFLADVREKAVGEDVLKSLTPAQQVIKIVNEELTKLLGGTAKELRLSGKMPSVILLAGVQGSGKTTSAAKLAKYLKEKNKSVMLAACDIKRAAAATQLKTLADSIGVYVYGEENSTPEQTAKNALKYAAQKGYEILIVDTAGRQQVNEELMDEICGVQKAVNAEEVLFVADCMMGQQAVDAAREFDSRLGITGFILSKADSDARGGAALSVTYVTEKPIKFAATGEKLDDFELFHPDRIASRILGMADVLTLIEKAEKFTDEEKQRELTKKIAKSTFTLEDYLEQMESLQNMGRINEMLASVMGARNMAGVNIDEKQIARTKAIIQSMTLKERRNPQLLNASRRKRIAAGSGTTVADVNRLMNGFEQAKKMMKQMKGSKRKFPGGNFPFM